MKKSFDIENKSWQLVTLAREQARLDRASDLCPLQSGEAIALRQLSNAAGDMIGREIDDIKTEFDRLNGLADSASLSANADKNACA